MNIYDILKSTTYLYVFDGPLKTDFWIRNTNASSFFNKSPIPPI